MLKAGFPAIGGVILNITNTCITRSDIPGAVKQCRLSPKNRLLHMRGHSAGLGVNWAAKWSGDLGQGRELRLRPAVYPVGMNNTCACVRRK